MGSGIDCGFSRKSAVSTPCAVRILSDVMSCGIPCISHASIYKHRQNERARSAARDMIRPPKRNRSRIRYQMARVTFSLSGSRAREAKKSEAFASFASCSLSPGIVQGFGIPQQAKPSRFRSVIAQDTACLFTLLFVQVIIKKSQAPKREGRALSHFVPLSSRSMVSVIARLIKAFTDSPCPAACASMLSLLPLGTVRLMRSYFAALN